MGRTVVIGLAICVGAIVGASARSDPGGIAERTGGTSYREYSAAIAEIMTCMRGDGFEVIGPFPVDDPDQQPPQLIFDIGLPEQAADDDLAVVDRALVACRSGDAGRRESAWLREHALIE